MFVSSPKGCQYEFLISKPKLILKNIDGVESEPMENVHIEVPQEYSGSVIEELSHRRSELRQLRSMERSHYRPP